MQATKRENLIIIDGVMENFAIPAGLGCG